MKFSIFFGYQRIHPPEYYKNSLYQERLDEAIEADRLGLYECIWLPEHHLIHFMQVPCGLLLCAQIGLKVKTKVGQMVNLLTARHPLIIAGEVAAADIILGGKLLLGVGRGAYEYEFERLGVPFSESKERFDEALQVIEKVWKSEKEGISFHGKYFNFETAYVWPRPVQKPHPEIWYAAMTKPAIDWAARKGYHVATWPFLRPMSSAVESAELFHRGRETAGNERGKQKLTMLRVTFIAETEAKARRFVEPVLVNHRINQRLHYFTQNSDPRGYVYPEPVENEPTPDEVYKHALMGTPEQCLEKVLEYERAGVDELMLFFDFGPDHEDVLDAMRLFAEEVIIPYKRMREPANKVPVMAAK